MSTHFSPQRAIYGAGWDVPLAPTGGDRSARRCPASTRTTPARRCSPRRAARRPRNSSRRSSWPRRRHQAQQRLRRGPAATGPRVAGARRRRGRPQAARRAGAGDRRRLAAEVVPRQCALLEGEFDTAAADFDAVLAMLPGELDPKLALAATAELRGRTTKPRATTRRYGGRTTPTTAPRSGWRGSVRGRETERARSRHSTRSPPRQRISPRRARPRSRSCSTAAPPTDLDEPTLLDAGGRASALTLESATKRATIRLQVLDAALDWLQAGNTPKAATAARCRLRRSGHPDRDGTAATARWRTRRPMCGSASPWWKRPMRSGRGPEYDRRAE